MVQTTQQAEAVVFVVEDDVDVRDGITSLLEAVGLKVTTFGSADEFLQIKRPDVPSCLLLDVRLPGISGIELQAKLKQLGIYIPVIFMTGYPDLSMGVQAIKAGAVDFLCKPFSDQDLLDAIASAVERDTTQHQAHQSLSKIQASFATLTQREREVMTHVASGYMNKQIADMLGIATITVKVHRSNLMRKMGLKSLADLVRVVDMLSANEAKDGAEPETAISSATDPSSSLDS